MTAVLTRRPGLGRIRAAAGSPLHLVCLVLVAFVVLAALFAPWLVPHDPNDVDLGSALAAPSAAHPLGVDAAGRDTLSRLLLGARTSLLGPLGVVVFSTVAGVAVGTAAAWRGGWLDSLLSRSTELVFAFPGMLLAILIISVYGEGLTAPVIALAVATCPTSAASPVRSSSPSGPAPTSAPTGSRATPASRSACATSCPTSPPSSSPSPPSTSATPSWTSPDCRSSASASPR